MAKRAGKGGKAGKRRRSGVGASRSGSSTHAPSSLTEIHLLLDRLDDAMLSGDLKLAEATNARLFQRSSRAADVLAQRLIEGRARIPLMAFQLLELFGGERTATLLRRIASERRAPDIIRWGAHRRAGWPEEGEAPARLRFLASLQDPAGTLVDAVAGASVWWPPDPEVLEEVVGYLMVLPAARQLQLVSQVVAQGSPSLAWLLRALLHFPNAAIQRVALEEISRLRDRDAMGALSRLAATTNDPDLRAEADTATRRLQIGLAGAVKRSASGQPWPRLLRAALTEVDGAGGQVILLGRDWGEAGGITIVDILVTDTWGIKGVYGRSHALGEEVFEEFADGLQEEGLALVDVDLAAARGVIALGMRANAATGHPIPPAFELWECFLHATWPPAEDESCVVPQLDDSLYVLRADLLRSSDKLLDDPLFGGWFFDVEETARALAQVAPPRDGRMTARQYRLLIEALVDEARCGRAGRHAPRQPARRPPFARGHR